MHLLTTRRFLPLFITQFLGAFNDNLFKNAVVMLLAFKIAEESGYPANTLVIAAGGLFILPYLLFSATAGQMADKFERARLARLTKLWEIIIVAAGAIGFLGHHPTFLLFVLFGLGAQSTFFGPVKYALLPQHLADDELVAGNAMVEAGTFLAILLGTITGGLLVMADNGEIYIVAATVVVALLGYASSWFIPKAPAPMPELALSGNIVSATWDMVQRDRTQRRVFRCILGISWFWLVGAVYLSQFPALAKDMLGGDEGVVTLFLAMFSVGIGVGSMLSNILVKGKIDSRFVPYAAFAMALLTLDLVLASWGKTHDIATPLMGISAFVADSAHWRVLADLFLFAVAGGVFIVPLYAIMQHDSDVNYRARTIASNNIVNALFMVLSALISGGMVEMGLGVPHILALLVIGNVITGLYVRKVRKASLPS